MSEYRSLSTMEEISFLFRVYRNSVQKNDTATANLSLTMLFNRIAPMVLLPTSAGCFAFVVVALIGVFNS